MSKIFDAYKKQARTDIDIVQEASRSGSIALFPNPGELQNSEFGKLANRLLGLRQDHRGSAICFASTVAEEGASFVSYHTARILARDYGQRVVWVYGNFLSPQKRLNGLNLISLSTLIRTPAMVEDIIPSGNPHLIPGGDNLVGARGYFASEKYSRLLDKLKQEFDFVILDLPPVLKSTDTALMAEKTDGFLLVVEQKFLKWEIINHGVETLKEKNVRILGSVINRRKFDLPKVLYDRL